MSNLRRVVILNLTTYEPEAVFTSAHVAAQYFNTSTTRIFNQCTYKPNLPLFGYLFRYADSWEEENGELLPGAKVDLPT